MQFEALQVFCDVARNRSFSQAALINGVTQSAVSQMVAQLERTIGVQLIDRSTRPLQLTPLGRTYYEGCRQMLEEYHNLVARLRSAQARVEGTVQVAAIYSVGLSDMGHIIERFHRRAPDVQVQIDYLHPDQVYKRVLNGEADIGLVSFPKKLNKLVVLPWRKERMVLACPVGRIGDMQPKLPLSRLDGINFVHFSRELVIRREVDRFLRSRKVNVKVTLEFDNVENIKKAVEIGAGVALLPEPTFRTEVKRGSLLAVELEDAEFYRPLGIIRRRQQKLNLALQGFIDELRNAASEGQGSEPAADSNGASTKRSRRKVSSKVHR